MRNHQEWKQNEIFFVFIVEIDMLFDMGQKKQQTILLHQRGTKYSKKNNNLF